MKNRFGILLGLLLALCTCKTWAQYGSGTGSYGSVGGLNGQSGNAAGLTNTAGLYPGLNYSQAPIAPLINVNTFESGNEFGDTNWATNIFGFPAAGVITGPGGIWTNLQTSLCYCSEAWVTNMVNFVTRTGLRDLGVNLITLGDGQYLTNRDANGNLQANSGFFPHGFKWLTSYVHSNGLFLGSYIAMGDFTCCGCPGSGYPIAGLSTQPDRIAQDIYCAYTNGFDGLYIDNCSGALNTTATSNLAAQVVTMAIREANQMANNAAVISGTDFSDHHNFYVGGPTANYPLNVQFSTITPDTLLGGIAMGVSSTAAGSAGGNSHGLTNAVYIMEAFMRAYKWALGPKRASLFMTTPGLSSLYPMDLSDWSSCFALVPSQLEFGHPTFYAYGFQNALLFSLFTNQASMCGSLVYSNNLAKVYSRPLGGATGPIGQSNVVYVANLNPSSSQTITISNTMMGLPYYTPMIAWDVIGNINGYHGLLTNYYGSFNVTVPATNKALIYCFPWDPLNNPSTNPPPAAAYPIGSRIQWCSNVPPLSGNVYALRSDRTGNNTWVSTNLIETAPALAYDITTNIQYRVDFDPSRGNYQRGEKIDPLPDFGLNGYNAIWTGFSQAPPTGTNDPNSFHGRVAAHFSGTNNYINGIWNTAVATNSISYAQPVLVVFCIDYEQQSAGVGQGIMLEPYSGANFFITANNPGGTQIQASAGGSNLTCPIATNTGPHVVAVYFNGASSFIATNNVASGGYPTNANTANAGANAIGPGLCIGDDTTHSGLVNWTGNLWRMLVFTNASTFVNTPAYTNMFLYLSNM